MTINIDRLRNWFLAEKRDLPWRETSDPYAIWISEVMLQQTQAAVVIPYYLRWMERFPTIKDLADAPINEVIKLWEGLGYYSRGRNLHEGARYLLENCNGQVPSNEEQLNNLKGLGPYTIGAILSFAFHQKKAAVDGNVLRVIARYFQLNDDITKISTQKKIRQLVESFLPENEHWIINEALIELGATICQRKAKCSQCPLSAGCLSYQNDCVENFPVKKCAPKTTFLFRTVAVIECGGEFLVQQRGADEIMAGLYEFPFFESNEKGISSKYLLQLIKKELKLQAKTIQPLPKQKHSFTRYQVHLEPMLVNISNKKDVANSEWMSLKDLQMVAFSSGHRRIFQHLSSMFG